MKHTIIIIAALVAASANAQTVRSKDGNETWTAIAGTMRAVTVRGERQIEMLWDADDKAAGTSERIRLGVTGCAEGTGDVRKLYNGIAISHMPWADAGDKVIDGLAIYQCKLWRGNITPQ